MGADTGAVDVIDPSKVQQDFPCAVAQQSTDTLAKLLGSVVDRDFSSELQNRHSVHGSKASPHRSVGLPPRGG